MIKSAPDKDVVDLLGYSEADVHDEEEAKVDRVSQPAV